jgi:hypothetical protein
MSFHFYVCHLIVFFCEEIAIAISKMIKITTSLQNNNFSITETDEYFDINNNNLSGGKWRETFRDNIIFMSKAMSKSYVDTLGFAYALKRHLRESWCQ